MDLQCGNSLSSSASNDGERQFRSSMIVIIHEIPLMRFGLLFALKKESRYAECDIFLSPDLASAEEMLARTGAGDVVLLDAPAWLALTALENRALFQSMQTCERAVGIIASIKQFHLNAFRTQGIAGIIDPESTLEDIVKFIDMLGSGTTQSLALQGADETRQLSQLTTRQVEVLDLMSKGLRTLQIAARLGISNGTVKSHITNIFRKLECTHRTTAIKMYMQSL